MIPILFKMTKLAFSLDPWIPEKEYYDLGLIFVFLTIIL